MHIFTSIATYRDWLTKFAANQRIGFVPTMGCLHEGHLSLIRESKRNNDFTVSSIFVNPLQFGPKEDLNTYPRVFEQDKELLERECVDVLFYPEVSQMYPQPLLTRVAVTPDFEGKLCGPFRPGHFQGVATVVLKLFNIISPSTAYFGLKDYQQFILIRQMVRDFNLPMEIIGLPTVRESDGLAMSSRNRYLSTGDRLIAPQFYKALSNISLEWLSGDISDDESMRVRFSSALVSLGFSVQYIEKYDRNLNSAPFEPQNTVIAAAVFLGKVRLIDAVLC